MIWTTLGYVVVSPGIICYIVLVYRRCWLNMGTRDAIWGGIGAVCGEGENCAGRSLAILWSITSILNIVDNAEGDDQISILFTDKYNNLYNSVSYEPMICM